MWEKMSKEQRLQQTIWEFIRYYEDDDDNNKPAATDINFNILRIKNFILKNKLASLIIIMRGGTIIVMCNVDQYKQFAYILVIIH